MTKGKDKGLVQLRHQHGAPLCDIQSQGYSGQGQELCWKSTQAVGQKDTGHSSAYWDLEVDAYTDPGRHGSQASGWFLRGLNE